MSILEVALASGQLAALRGEKIAWPTVTHPVVQDSNLLRSTPTELPNPVPEAPATPTSVSQTWNLQEQAKTRLEPQRKLSGLDSERMLAESIYATYGPDGVMRMIGSNPQLRGPMLGHVRSLAGAASPRPQYGMFSGVMKTQSLPLRAAVSGKIGAELCTTCRKEKHYGPCSAPRPIPAKSAPTKLAALLITPRALAASAAQVLSGYPLYGAGTALGSLLGHKMADFNPGLTAASSEAGVDSPSTSPHYHSATSADSSLARARDGRPADEQAGTNFADLFRHLGITSQTDEPGRMYGGLHKVSYTVNHAALLGGGLTGRRVANKLSSFMLPGSETHSSWEKRGPGLTPNPYEERLQVKSPPLGWGDEGKQRIRRSFDQIDGAVDTTNIENNVPDAGPAVGI